MMQGDSRMALAVTGDGDVDRLGRVRSKVPEPGRGAMAEHGTLAAGEDGSEAAPTPRQGPVADPVDTAVDPAQPPGSSHPSNPSTREPQPPQLPSRHNAILPLR